MSNDVTFRQHGDARQLNQLDVGQSGLRPRVGGGGGAGMTVLRWGGTPLIRKGVK